MFEDQVQGSALTNIAEGRGCCYTHIPFRACCHRFWHPTNQSVERSERATYEKMRQTRKPKTWKSDGSMPAKGPGAMQERTEQYTSITRGDSMHSRIFEIADDR
jgi:hypothetical protein